jgi:uncharacterized membrane protein YedE/YeeE
MNRLRKLAALAAGLLFGLGLIVSGMADPAKVLAFSIWPVIGIPPGLGHGRRHRHRHACFHPARGRSRSLLGAPMQLPTARGIDRRLVLGSVLFGVGWGLAGICPGPALVLLGMGSLKGLAFVMAMLAGMLLFAWIERLQAK